MYALLAIIASTVLVAPTAPGNYDISRRVDGVRRDYRLHLPPSYDGQKPFPVILAFHGMSANAKLLQKLTELDKTSDKYGFITVYPNGTGVGLLKAFKAGADTCRLAEQKPDDVLFVHTILDDLEQSLCIDRRRVYATGLSNGAMMCYRLAVEMPDRIAAIAPVSGAMGTKVCLPSCPVSVLHFHGTCDKVLPYNGPREGIINFQKYYTVGSTIQCFANAAHCVALPRVTELPNLIDDHTTVVVHSYMDCDPGVELTLVVIKGGGHQWPMRRLPIRYLGDATMEIDANEMMCSFFLRHMLPARGYVELSDATSTPQGPTNPSCEPHSEHFLWTQIHMSD